jgi:hypothetical protein
MRAVILRSLGVIGLGLVVLTGVLYVASTVDARAPEVLSISVTQPVAGDAETALITTSIEVAFSEPVDPAAAEALRIEPSVPGTASWSGSTLIFTPGDPLELEATYTVQLDGAVRDVSGNEMTEAPAAFTFTTAGRPTVVETTPAADATDVALDAPITLRFSSLMDTASVESRLELRPTFRHELRWSGEVLEIIPSEPLGASRTYELHLEDGAVDVAGVELAAPFALVFTTVAPGLAADTLVPADGVDGVAPSTPIAVLFDRPIDPDSIDPDRFTITPTVAGTLEVVAAADDPPSDAGAGRILRFQPSGPLPATTTFDVVLEPGVASVDGGAAPETIAWSFTTGAPPASISNQITFLTDRSGVTNVWAMNPDGTGQRQLSAELAPVLDYAVAPDGSSLVVADGRRLVFLRADGSERRVLTDPMHLEFDPAFAPNGSRIAFGRADAATGTGLGLWTWAIGSGAADRVVLPSEDAASPSPRPSTDGELLRAPRFAPDGRALAFVDPAGAVGIFELDSSELTRAAHDAAGPPVWLPDGSAVIVPGRARLPVANRVEAPVLPLDAPLEDGTLASTTFGRLERGGGAVMPTDLLDGALLAIAGDGRIAVVDARGTLRISRDSDDAGEAVDLDGATVSGAAFAPSEELLVIVTGDNAEAGRVERLSVASGRRTSLAPEGSRPRWLP